MAKVDFGSSGVSAVSLLTEAKDVPMADLIGAENIFNHMEPTIQVEAAKGGKIELEHRVAGKLLPDGAIKKAQGGKFRVKLFRGRNDFTVRVEGHDEAYEFPVYYKSVAMEWVESLLKALILVVVVKTFVIQAFFIPTGSMEDTLFPSDYILVEKVTGLFHEPARGDVIVFQFPEDPTKDFIKRKIGDDGDVLWMREKQLYMNGQCMQEDYVVHKDQTQYPRDYVTLRDHWDAPRAVPPGHSYALGDNRDNSRDSRFWGPLPDYRLKGRALCIYWPPRRWRLIRPQLGRALDSCP